MKGSSGRPEAPCTMLDMAEHGDASGAWVLPETHTLARNPHSKPTPLPETHTRNPHPCPKLTARNPHPKILDPKHHKQVLLRIARASPGDAAAAHHAISSH